MSDKIVPIGGVEEEEEIDIDLIAIFDYPIYAEVSIGDGFIVGVIYSRMETFGEITSYRVVGVRADGMPYDDWVFTNQLDVPKPTKKKS